MERKQYQSIDLMKIICAFLIIDIHTSTLLSLSNVAYTVCRHIIDVVAVPLFFVAGGFLFFQKLNACKTNQEKNKAYRGYALRILQMYLIYTVVYLPFVIYSWVTSGDFNGMMVLSYLKRCIFEGSFATLWFLPALLVAVTAVFLLSKVCSSRVIFGISIPFYLFALLGSSYYGLAIKLPVVGTLLNGYYSFFDTIKNGLLFGFLFVAMGACFAAQKRTFRLRWYSWAAVIVLWGIMGLEALLQWKMGWASKGVDTNLFLVPLAASLFCFVLGAQEKWGEKLARHNRLFVHLRKLSVLLFLCQRIFITLFTLFGWSQINSVLWTLLILGSTLAFSELILWLSGKWRIFRYLY